MDVVQPLNNNSYLKSQLSLRLQTCSNIYYQSKQSENKPSCYINTDKVWTLESEATKTSTNEKQQAPSFIQRSKVPFYFKSCQWTADGSSVLTTSSDNALRLFLVPPDSLQNHNDTDQSLLPYIRICFPSAPTGVSLYPGFDISQYHPALALVSCVNQPIRLYNLHDSTLASGSNKPNSLASYPLYNPNLDTFDNALSIVFPNSNNYSYLFEDSDGITDSSMDDIFLAGTQRQRGRVDMFSLLRPGSSFESSPPLASAFVPSFFHGTNCHGYKKAIVSSIACKPLTYQQNSSYLTVVGFYQGGKRNQNHFKPVDENGRGKFKGNIPFSELAMYDFRVGETSQCILLSKKKKTSQMKDNELDYLNYGNGTYQVLWNPPGSATGSEHLVYQVLRNSPDILVRDSRMGLLEVGWLFNTFSDEENVENSTRKLYERNQRVESTWVPRTSSPRDENENKQDYYDTFRTDKTVGFDLWVGGSNGRVSVFKNPAHNICQTRQQNKDTESQAATVEHLQMHGNDTTVCGLSIRPKLLQYGIKTHLAAGNNDSEFFPQESANNAGEEEYNSDMTLDNNTRNITSVIATVSGTKPSRDIFIANNDSSSSDDEDDKMPTNVMNYHSESEFESSLKIWIV